MSRKILIINEYTMFHDRIKYINFFVRYGEYYYYFWVINNNDLININKKFSKKAIEKILNSTSYEYFQYYTLNTKEDLIECFELDKVNKDILYRFKDIVHMKITSRNPIKKYKIDIDDRVMNMLIDKVINTLKSN